MREGEKKGCDKEELRRDVEQGGELAGRVHLDVTSRQFSSNYVPSLLCIMLIFRILGVMTTFCSNI